jgi:hypothetical protein
MMGEKGGERKTDQKDLNVDCATIRKCHVPTATQELAGVSSGRESSFDGGTRKMEAR